MKKGIVALLVVVVIGLGAVFYMWSNQPLVAIPKPAANQPSSLAPAKKQPIESKYFASSLSDQYVIKSLDETGMGDIFSQMLLRNREPRLTDQIAITIGHIPASIAELSAVQFRKRNSEIYKQDSLPGLPEDAIVYKKLSGGYERSVFWPDGSSYAAVVVSASIDRTETMDGVLQKFIADWHWKHLDTP